MQSTSTVWPNSDAVSGELSASVANNKSSAPTYGTDSAVEADSELMLGLSTHYALSLEKAMRRFAERGPPSGPARGPPSHPAQYPSRDSASGTSHTAPPASTTGNGRKPAQTAIGHTTSSQKKARN
ncbi:hypothetical protein H4582DRAFT_2065011 [Lactarius indigo]|nr:hypothetical protein H4582DRAFT_2065011 [Lactarius indigo]